MISVLTALCALASAPAADDARTLQVYDVSFLTAEVRSFPLRGWPRAGELLLEHPYWFDDEGEEAITFDGDFEEPEGLTTFAFGYTTFGANDEINWHAEREQTKLGNYGAFQLKVGTRRIQWGDARVQPFGGTIEPGRVEHKVSVKCAPGKPA